MGNLEIIEKPDWVLWDDIHEVLWKSHKNNRARGINMPNPGLPGEEIKEMIEEHHGVMLVALVDEKLVGTAAVYMKERHHWYLHGVCAYNCFAAVLPEYNGMGIYKGFNAKREETTRAMGLSSILFNTHERNKRLISINKKNGYKLVDFVVGKDCYYVFMMKWLDGCPYSDWYIRRQFLLRKWYRKLRYKPGGIKRFGI